jgi:hypothetical protein
MLKEKGAGDADGPRVLHLAQAYTDYDCAPFEVLVTDGKTYGLEAGPLLYVRAARGANFPKPKLAEDGALRMDAESQIAGWSTQKRGARYGGGAGSSAKWGSGYGGYGNYQSSGGGSVSYGGGHGSSGGFPRGTPPARSDADPWATWKGKS